MPCSEHVCLMMSCPMQKPVVGHMHSTTLKLALIFQPPEAKPKAERLRLKIEAKVDLWYISWELFPHVYGCLACMCVCAPSSWVLWDWRYNFSHYVGVRNSPGFSERVIKSLNLWVSSLAPHRFLSSMIFVVTSIRSMGFFYLFFHEFFDVVIKSMCFLYI